jgi:hypothetical protein
MRLHPIFSLTLGLLLLSSSITGRALADARACIANNERGGALRARGELSAARAAYLHCAEDACPGVIRDECQSLVKSIDAAMPTVLLAAKGPRGDDVLGVRVFVDGREHPPGVDGRPLPVDPGEHTFRFESRDQVRELRAIIREGEKHRALQVELAAREPPQTRLKPTGEPAPLSERPAGTRPVPPLAYVLAATGFVALGSFGYFALRGNAQQSDLQARCAPSCPPEEARSMHGKYLAADVSLALAALSLGGATYVYVTRPPAFAASGVARSPAGLPDGAHLQLAGRF